MHSRWIALAIIVAAVFFMPLESRADIKFGGTTVGSACTVTHGDGTSTSGKRNAQGECCKTTCDNAGCATECWSQARTVPRVTRVPVRERAPVKQ